MEQHSSTSPTSINLSNSQKSQLGNSGFSTGAINHMEDEDKKLDDDLKLRAALYGVLFQTYVDKVSMFVRLCDL